jgi:hypothetical protein
MGPIPAEDTEEDDAKEDEGDPEYVVKHCQPCSEIETYRLQMT